MALQSFFLLVFFFSTNFFLFFILLQIRHSQKESWGYPMKIIKAMLKQMQHNEPDTYHQIHSFWYMVWPIRQLHICMVPSWHVHLPKLELYFNTKWVGIWFSFIFSLKLIEKKNTSYKLKKKNIHWTDTKSIRD